MANNSNPLYPKIPHPSNVVEPIVYQPQQPVNFSTDSFNNYQQNQYQQHQQYNNYPHNSNYQQFQQCVTINQPFNPSMLGNLPANLVCPNCHARVLTRIDKSTGCGTCLAIGGVCLIGCFLPCLWFGCQFIPCCVDDCLDTEHYCPNCNSYLGKNKVI